MNSSRKLVAEALMRPLVIKWFGVITQAGNKLQHRGVLLDIDVHVLYGAPKRSTVRISCENVIIDSHQ